MSRSHTRLLGPLIASFNRLSNVCSSIVATKSCFWRLSFVPVLTQREARRIALHPIRCLIGKSGRQELWRRAGGSAAVSCCGSRQAAREPAGSQIAGGVAPRVPARDDLLTRVE